MVRGLLINLAITSLTSALLFLYFRNRWKVIEHKVNSIFQLVQNHIQRPPTNRFMPPFVRQPHNIIPKQNPSLIEVSDDSESSDDSDDSGSESDQVSIKQEQLPTSPESAPTSPESAPTSEEPTQIHLDEDNLSDDSLSTLSDEEDAIETNPVETPLIPTPNMINNLKRLTVAELKKMATSRGLKKFSKFNKTQLVNLLAIGSGS